MLRQLLPLPNPTFKHRKRVFDPEETVYTWILQALGQDQSCRDAVANAIAHRLVTSQRCMSALTGAYCQARKRLPLEYLEEVFRSTVPKSRLRVVDGTTLSMPDTPELREEFSQHGNQAEGVGFPLGRMVGIFSLEDRSILDWELRDSKGKGTGETTMFNQCIPRITPGSTVVGDQLYDSYASIALLRGRGCHCLFKTNTKRKDVPANDEIVRITKHPKIPRSMDYWTYKGLPDWQDVRLVDGLTTTLTKPSASELGDLYRRRWDAELNWRTLKAELNWRTLKAELHLDFLRCKSPEMIRKGIFVHLIGCNLLCRIAASGENISLKACSQALTAFSAIDDHDAFMHVVNQYSVKERPGRREPRVVKRRPKQYYRMTEPRDVLRARL